MNSNTSTVQGQHRSAAFGARWRWVATAICVGSVACSDQAENDGLSVDVQDLLSQHDSAEFVDLGPDPESDTNSSDLCCLNTEPLGDSSGTTSDSESGVPGGVEYSRCSYLTKTGRFTVDLKESSTSIDGVVADGVVPQNLPVVTLAEGGCSLLYPATLFCEPACEPGFTCNSAGTCIPYPQNQSVGTVTFLGLSGAVSLNPIPPQQIYYFTGTLPYPGFAAGQPVTLNAAGGAQSPFSLVAKGVSPLVPISRFLPFDAAEPAVVSWEKAEPDPATAIFLAVHLANHGGVPARIECIVPDTGEFTIPANLVSALLDIGYSGFPTVTIRRESVSSVVTDLGCIELVLQSEVVLDVAIDGLTSCSSSEDCPVGQTCQLDLHCQ